MISHYKLIIVPVDGSDSASRAAAFAADLARATESPIQLLYIYSPSAREVMGMAHLPKDQIESISHESAAMAFTKARMAMDLEVCRSRRRVSGASPGRRSWRPPKAVTPSSSWGAVAWVRCRSWSWVACPTRC